MSTVARSVLATLVLLGTVAGAAWCDDPEGSVSVWFRPSWQYADLDAANDLIKDGNQIFARQEFSGMDEFHDVFSLGLEVNVDVSDRFTLYFGAGSLFGSRKKSFNRVIETRVDGGTSVLGVMYRVPWISKWEDALDDLDLFVGVGSAYADVEFTASDEDLTTLREFLEERIFTGDGVGVELRLGLEYFLAPSFTLVGSASYSYLEIGDMEHELKVNNPNAFNADGDLDGDGLANQFDPDYDPPLDPRGNTRIMYRFCEFDESGECDYQKPDDRYLESIYKYDPDSYAAAPPSFQVYDPSAAFDLGLSGFRLQIGLAYYVF